MKPVFTTLLVFQALAAFCQPYVQRASQANTVADARLSALLNFHLPRYQDTASANLQLGVDSAGALIYTRLDGRVWKRTAARQWVEVGASAPGSTLQSVLTAGNTAVNSSFFLKDATSRSAIAAQVFNNGDGSSTSSFTVLNTSSNDKVQLQPGFLSIHGNLPLLRFVKTNTGFYLDLAPQSLSGSSTILLPDKSGTLATLSDIPAAGGAAWGEITGTLSSQTDLQTALNAKAGAATTLSGYGITDAYTKTQSDGRYLQSYAETDPLYTASSWYTTTNNAANWNAAYGWGNHAGLYPLLTGAYANPAWISSLAWSKITGAPAFLTTESDPKRVTTAGVTGTASKTLTLTLADASTVSATFTDQGLTSESDVKATASGTYAAGTLTLTKGDATTVTISGFPTNTNQLTNGAGYIANITGLVTAGTNITLTGSGTAASPYSIANGVTNNNQLTNGAGYITASTATVGSLLNVRFLTTGTTYTPTTGTTKAVFHVMGGGGGGGGVSGAASSVGAAAGGGAGGYLIKYSPVSDATTYTIAIGAGGSAGANTGGNGGAGSQSFITIGATTYSAAGGAGGAGQTAGTAAAVALGGTAGSSTNGDVVGGGQNGDNAVRLSGTVGISGAGGTSLFGTGGAALVVANTGSNAIGYGSGGGGALSTANAAKTGGTGAPGIIIVYEYR